MEEKVTMVRLNLSSDDIRIVKKQRSLKKRILNLAYKQGHLFEKFKEPDKFRASETCKSAKKQPKLEVVIYFKYF